MENNKEKSVFVFQSTREFIKAEKLLKKTSVKFKVIPVPKNISAECGMCLLANSENLSEINKLLCVQNIIYLQHEFSKKK